MRLKISQRTDAFFELFSKSAVNIREAVALLRDLVDDYRDVELKARRIQEREHDGDEITHDVIRRLNTTFITPMDREDIYTLATALDDVLDAVEEAADVFVLHNIVEKSGTWFSYRGERIGQGRENAKQFLKENKDLAAKLEAEVRKAIGLHSPGASGSTNGAPKEVAPPAHSKAEPPIKMAAKR